MRNDIIQLFENCGLNTPNEYLIEGASAKAPQYKINSPEEFEMLVSQDPTYDSSKDDGKFIDWIFSLWRNYKTDKKNEEKYNRALAYKQEHPDAQLPSKPKRLSQDKADDFQKIRDYLEVLSKNLKDLKGNMGQFKSIAELASFVNKIRDRNVTVDEKAQKNFKIFREAMADGLEIVYNGPNFIIGVPTTYESSSHFKKPITEWCTAYPDMYDLYLKKGGIYYIHLNKHTGELYQAHYESDQFKDRNDKEINKEKFISKYPELKSFYDKIWDMNNYEWWILHDRKPTNKELDFIISQDPQRINYMDSNLQVYIVHKNGLLIKYLKKPTEVMKLAAVKQDGRAIKYIENPSEELQLAAVKQDGRAIKYIENPNKEVQLVAFNNNYSAIEYIENPTEDMKHKAVKEDGYLIRFIKNPSEEVQLAAVQQNGMVIDCIEQPSEKVQLEAIKNIRETFGNDLAIYTIFNNIKNPTKKVKQLAHQLEWES